MSIGQTVVDYASLEQYIQDMLARNDLTDYNYLPEILQMGQDRIFNGFMDNKGNYFPGIRVRQMEKNLGSGMISAVTITSGGTGYAAADTIAFTAAPAGGVTATGTLTLASGVITGVNINNPGLGYTAAPTITITTSTGSGASLSTTIITNSIEIGPHGTYAVPSDYLELKRMVLTDTSNTTRMIRKTAEWIYQYYPDRTPDSLPQYVARDNDVFIFGPYPDSQYSLSGVYYYKPAYLTSSTTNFLVTSYPGLLVAACLAEASLFTRDTDGVQFWDSRFQMLARTVQATSDHEAFSGSPLSMSPG
ncbi:MAG: hypothetical protein KGH65_03830 [Candidatus Micrarchaeota archaeon]|nr:hypothetical protein [Candidatus Micrarchaeota archaeon]